MRGFLQKLARSVVRPQPNPHPFVESIYPTQGAKGTHSVQSPEIAVGIARPQPAAAQPISPLHDRPLTAAGNRHPDVLAWQRDEVPSDLEERAASQAQSYRPLLPPRETQVSVPSELIPPLRRPTETDSPEAHETQVSSSDSEAGAVRAAVSAPPTREELKPAPPMLPHFDAQALLSARKTAAAPAQVAQHVQHERKADDIQINIGRIEVIAVPPTPPIRHATPPARKGTSLDEYLSRRNGRAG